MRRPGEERVYVIAEAGVNHNGSLATALDLVEAAARAGADAVKFQTFSAAALASATVQKADYQKARGGGATQREMLEALELGEEDHRALQRRARDLGIDFMSTPFDLGSLDLLMSLGMPLMKVPSGEITNARMLWHYGRAGLPLVVSTGMASLGEVEAALAVLAHGAAREAPPSGLAECMDLWAEPAARRALLDRTVLLHCTSNYPTPPEEANMRAMLTLRDAFGCPVGYSDHTEGPLVSVMAVAMGARVIEKHFTLDRAMPGPDHAASLEPGELASMMEQIRRVERAFGDPAKMPQPSEMATRRAARQQVVAARDLAAGETMGEGALATSRAGGGLSAMEFWDVCGGPAPRALRAGEALDP